MAAPPHELMRIEVTPVSQWDVFPTRIYVEAYCLDRDGRRLHTVVHTRFNYLDVPGSLAVCKDLKYILGLLKTDKLENKPLRCELVIHDFLAFGYATRQIDPPRRDLKTWVTQGYAAARQSKIPVMVKLGDPAKVLEYRAHSESRLSEGLTPSLEQTGDNDRKFVREETKCRK